MFQVTKDVAGEISIGSFWLIDNPRKVGGCQLCFQTCAVFQVPDVSY